MGVEAPLSSVIGSAGGKTPGEARAIENPGVWGNVAARGSVTPSEIGESIVP